MNIHTSFFTASTEHHSPAYFAKIGLLENLKIHLDRGDIKLLQAAEALNKYAHGDILRDDGEYYDSHPRRMADQVECEEEKIVRLIHDVIEETLKYNQPKYKEDPRFKYPVTPADLLLLGFSDDVVALVVSVTRTDKYYLNSIMEVSMTEKGRKLRRHDIKDHLANSPKEGKKVAYEIGDYYLEKVDEGEVEPGSDIRAFAIEYGVYDQPTFDKYYIAPQRYIKGMNYIPA